MTDLENFAYNLHLRVCPLYRQQRRRAFLVGTGIPITTPSGAYIATATHVLDELHDGFVMTVGSESLIRFRTPSLSYSYVGGKTVDADVGLLGLPVQVAHDLALRYAFTTQSECGVVGDYDKFTLYVVVGYPHTRNKPQPEALATLCATPTFLVLREFTDVIRFASSGKHPEVHFGLSAPLGEARGLDFRAVAIPKLQGMSGGGVWRVNIDRRDGTIASNSLVGIVIEYRRAEAAIVATRLQYVLALLAR
jgi:hypothetical protein